MKLTTDRARSTERMPVGSIGAAVLCAGLAAALSNGPASAQTQAICKQEYAAKKAAGETGGQSQASYIKTCLSRGKVAPIKPAAATANGGAEPASGNSDADLAKKLANPIASLISVPFQSNLDYGGGPKGSGSQYILNIQPVIPFKLNNDWNLITRTIVPVTDVVNIIPGNPVGIGDTVQSFFLSPAQPINGIILGGGPVFLWPDRDAGRDQRQPVWRRTDLRGADTIPRPYRWHARESHMGRRASGPERTWRRLDSRRRRKHDPGPAWSVSYA
jgi:hypothetical protein